jgi:hypothetical protein
MPSRLTQYEDLPIEMRNLIIRKIREAREAAVTVFQKYTRGRAAHLVYKSVKHWMFLVPLISNWRTLYNSEREFLSGIHLSDELRADRRRVARAYLGTNSNNPHPGPWPGRHYWNG